MYTKTWQNDVITVQLFIWSTHQFLKTSRVEYKGVLQTPIIKEISKGPIGVFWNLISLELGNLNQLGK